MKTTKSVFNLLQSMSSLQLTANLCHRSHSSQTIQNLSACPDQDYWHCLRAISIFLSLSLSGRPRQIYQKLYLQISLSVK